MPIINIENAQIKTASVEIKTLTISGKQVTLSVFRQIEEESLIDDDTMKLNGIPWGLINYFWKTEYANHKIHVLWQNGKELRRDILLKRTSIEIGCNNISRKRFHEYEIEINRINYKISKIQSSDYSNHSEYQLDNIVFLRKKISSLENDIQKIKKGEKYIGHSEEERLNKLILRKSDNNAYYSSSNEEELKSLMSKKESGTLVTTEQHVQNKCNEIMMEINEYECNLNNSLENLKEYRLELNNLISQRNNYSCKYQELINSLLNLPKLFIAV
jgi:chromosome segregation ATPase